MRGRIGQEINETTTDVLTSERIREFRPGDAKVARDLFEHDITNVFSATNLPFLKEISDETLDEIAFLILSRLDESFADIFRAIKPGEFVRAIWQQFFKSGGVKIIQQSQPSLSF